MMAKQLPASIVKCFLQLGKQQKFPKNKAIFVEGEAADLIFFIVEGRVTLCKETASGRELTLRISSNGDCIGENILFTPLTIYPTSAKTLEATTLLSLSRQKLEQALQQEPIEYIACMNWLQIQALREQARLRDLLLHGKKGALFSTLIRIANTYGEQLPNNDIRIPQKFTNTNLANLCGTSREVVNRLLKELKNDRIIIENNSYITIKDLAYLKNFCECDSCPAIICKIN